MDQLPRHELDFFERHYREAAYNHAGWKLRFVREKRELLRHAVGHGHSLGQVLSIGCGDGQFELLIAEDAAAVVGIDLSPQAIDLAQRDAQAANVKNVRFCVGSFQELALGGPFDTIIALAFLHHLTEKDTRADLRRIKALLRRGGLLYSQDPSLHGVLRKIGRLVMGRTYNHYHSPDERELDPYKLQQDLLSVGFVQVELSWIDFTLIPMSYALRRGLSWPLYLCVWADRILCNSPAARWASGFTASAWSG